jgi:hypothetical protein
VALSPVRDIVVERGLRGGQLSERLEDRAHGFL